MKIKLSLFLIALSVLVLSSCKKEDENKPSSPAPTSSFSATINGTPTSWTVSRFTASGGGLFIYADEGTSNRIKLFILQSQSQGTYQLSSQVTASYTAPSGGTNINGNTGTIVISSITATTISGTFNFSQTGGGTVTNGSFSNVPKQ